MFKNHERVLVVGPTGWSTRIGRQSASRSWVQVAAVEDAVDAVVLVSVGGNALIISQRACPDAAARISFLRDAQRWHAARSG